MIASRVLSREAKSPERTAQPQGKEKVEDKGPFALVTPSPQPKRSPTKEASPMIARAAWSTNREGVLRDIPVEATRSESRTIDASSGQTKFVISLPMFDEQGRQYSSYRLTIAASGTRLWQQTLRAPLVSLTGYAQILDLWLVTQQLSGTGSYYPQVEGKSQMGWRSLGRVTFLPKEQ